MRYLLHLIDEEMDDQRVWGPCPKTRSWQTAETAGRCLPLQDLSCRCASDNSTQESSMSAQVRAEHKPSQQGTDGLAVITHRKRGGQLSLTTSWKPFHWLVPGICILFPAPRVNICFSQSCECHVKNFQLPSPWFYLASVYWRHN